MNSVKIDGSLMEGGGQILRNATTLSCLLNVPVTVYNIRAGRPKPGLCAQHLCGLQLLSDICKAQLFGGKVGSTEITLKPNFIQSGDFTYDVKSAGSICLLLQSALPVLMSANKPSSLMLYGGTNVSFAPQIDFYELVFLPFLARHFGLTYNLKVIRRGCYPKGGGEVKLSLEPVAFPLSPIYLLENDCEKHCTISGRAWASGAVPFSVAQKLAASCKSVLKREDCNIQTVKENGSSGAGLVVKCESDNGCIVGADSLLPRDSTAEIVGDSVARDLVVDMKGCVDRHMQDQIILFMALCDGKSKVLCGSPITLHTKTAIYISELLTGAKFTVKDVEAGDTSACIIECDGIGYRPPQ